MGLPRRSVLKLAAASVAVLSLVLAAFLAFAPGSDLTDRTHSLRDQEYVASVLPADDRTVYTRMHYTDGPFELRGVARVQWVEPDSVWVRGADGEEHVLLDGDAVRLGLYPSDPEMVDGHWFAWLDRVYDLDTAEAVEPFWGDALTMALDGDVLYTLDQENYSAWDLSTQRLLASAAHGDVHVLDAAGTVAFTYEEAPGALLAVDLTTDDAWPVGSFPEEPFVDAEDGRVAVAYEEDGRIHVLVRTFEGEPVMETSFAPADGTHLQDFQYEDGLWTALYHVDDVRADGEGHRAGFAFGDDAGMDGRHEVDEYGGFASQLALAVPFEGRVHYVESLEAFHASPDGSLPTWSYAVGVSGVALAVAATLHVQDHKAARATWTLRTDPEAPEPAGRCRDCRTPLEPGVSFCVRCGGTA